MEETEGRVKETVEARAGWTRWCVANSDDWFVFVPGRLVAPSTAGRRHWALAQAQGRGKYLAGPIPTGAVHASHRRHASWVHETLYGPGPQGSCFGLAASLPISPSPLDGRGRRTGVGSPSSERQERGPSWSTRTSRQAHTGTEFGDDPGGIQSIARVCRRAGIGQEF